ncbi:glycosyltransferase family 4 protein [Thermoflexibacter ruber]|uniref:Glycosyltransferase involved in cell wall bisynthesis n=1 Tax=Thermoflexibacter ruber TaxID=1003 RepID=A0A1I2A8T1_9BACT|nr:glycosyltransferase family 4 protein [Thermoflexibacter ruber]SFE40475.1 Glycosyltransferase involved in cell wall bisynthesis [Thermoflexibacter ruber]
MNIAFVGNYEENAVNGVVVSAYMQAKILVSLGHKVYFYFRSPRAFIETNKDNITKRGFEGQTLFTFLPNIYRFLQQNPDKIDIFHIHSVFIPLNKLFAFCFKRLHYKYVITPHGGYDPNILKRDWLKKQVYYFFFEKSLIGNANAIFCVAEKEKLSIEKLSYKGLVFTIPNPIDLENDWIDSTHYTDSQSLQEKYIVYMGRYDMQHKGLDTLLKIFKAIEEKQVNLSLHLYGMGEDLVNLKCIIQDLQLRKVFLHNPAFGEEKLNVFQNATAYIQNSRWEAFGISIFEAASAGLPLIVSEGVYMKDFISRHGIGIVLENNIGKAADQIIKFCADTDKLKEISHRIRGVVENHMSARVVGKLLEHAYSEAIKKY